MEKEIKSKQISSGVSEQEISSSNIKLTSSKIEKLLDFSHLEELYYLVNILDEKQVLSFLEHYKKSAGEQAKNKKIDSMLKNSKSKIELLKSIKKELIDALQGDLQKLKEKMSSLRKKGIDTFHEDILSMTIPLKIKMFNATANKEDFYKIKKTIEKINALLEQKTAELKKN